MPKVICSNFVYTGTQGTENLTVNGLLTVNGNSVFTNNLSVTGTVFSSSIKQNIIDLNGLNYGGTLTNDSPLIAETLSVVSYDGTSPIILKLPLANSTTTTPIKCGFHIDRHVAGGNALTIQRSDENVDEFRPGLLLPSRHVPGLKINKSVAGNDKVIWAPNGGGNDFLGRGSYFIFLSTENGIWDVYVSISKPTTGTGDTGDLHFGTEP